MIRNESYFLMFIIGAALPPSAACGRHRFGSLLRGLRAKEAGGGITAYKLNVPILQKRKTQPS